MPTLFDRLKRPSMPHPLHVAIAGGIGLTHWATLVARYGLATQILGLVFQYLGIAAIFVMCIQAVRTNRERAENRKAASNAENNLQASPFTVPGAKDSTSPQHPTCNQ